MIINLYGVVDNIGDVKHGHTKYYLYEIKFENLPTVYFNPDHYVYVNEMAISWKHKVNNVHGMLCSSLIDKSFVNPRQQLQFFYQNKSSNFTFISPTQIAQYKIQCTGLHSSVFQLLLSEKQDIEQLYLQLNIVFNARIQSIGKKPI